MAVASYAVEILGAYECKGGITVSYATIRTAFPTATVTVMKTQGVKVSINGCPMFDATYDSQNYLPATGTGTAVFNKDCILMVGKYVNVA